MYCFTYTDISVIRTSAGRITEVPLYLFTHLRIQYVNTVDIATIIIMIGTFHTRVLFIVPSLPCFVPSLL